MERAEQWFENFISDINTSRCYEAGLQPRAITAEMARVRYRDARENVTATLADWSLWTGEEAPIKKDTAES